MNEKRVAAILSFIEQSMEGYPGLFPTPFTVLDHLLLVNGNGYGCEGHGEPTFDEGYARGRKIARRRSFRAPTKLTAADISPKALYEQVVQRWNQINNLRVNLQPYIEHAGELAADVASRRYVPLWHIDVERNPEWATIAHDLLVAWMKILADMGVTDGPGYRNAAFLLKAKFGVVNLPHHV